LRLPIKNSQRWLLAALILVASHVFAAPKAYVFVSFSMPEPLLIETLKDSARFNVPAVLNGLHHNAMMETVNKISVLSQAIPSLQMQIDPTAFERFDIHQVPALVLENNGCFDVIYGHLSLQEGLSRMMRHGTCGVPRRELEEMRHA